MNRKRYFSIYTLLAVGLILAGWMVTRSWAQSAGSQGTTNVTVEQQKQLDDLNQMEQQLQKDRMAVHDAINKYGWDSDQVDDAQAKLVRDREQYRKLRRSLRQAGIAVPAAQGFGVCPNSAAGQGGKMMGRMGRGGPGGGPGRYGRRANRGAGCPCMGM